MLIGLYNGTFRKKASAFWGLCFTAEQDGSTISMQKTGTPPEVSLMYSTDAEIWNVFSIGETTVTLAAAGDNVWFKAGTTEGDTTNARFASGENIYSNFVITGKAKVSGNIMSLVGPEDFEEPTDEENSFCFSHLFYNCTGLTDASKLNLPANYIATHYYSSMFMGCTALKAAPKLPAIRCNPDGFGYYQMFRDCTSLTAASDINLLSASTITYMYYNCTSLKKAPNINFRYNSNSTSWKFNCVFQNCTSLETPPPAIYLTALYSGDCDNMFKGCVNLTSTPNMSISSLDSYACWSMFENCTKISSAANIHLGNVSTHSLDGMFFGCSSLTAGPELLHKSIASNSYAYLFYGCKSLAKVKVQLTSWGSASDATKYWMTNVSSNGIFVCPSQLGTNQTIQRGLTAYCPENWEVFNPDNIEGLNFVAQQANTTVSLSAIGTPPSIQLKYATPQTEQWLDFIPGETTITLQNVEDSVAFKALPGGNYAFATDLSNKWTFSIDGKVSCNHSIEYLIDENANPSAMSSNYCFAGLFEGCSAITTPPLINATTLTEHCYDSMFKNCILLKSTPSLLATQLVNGCYQHMFDGCSGLSAVNTNISSFEPSNATTNWLEGVAAEGKFNCLEILGDNTTILRGPSYCPENWEVYSENYAVKFIALEPNSSIQLVTMPPAPTVSLLYSTNGITWDNFIVGTTIVNLEHTGDYVYLKANPGLQVNNCFAQSTTGYKYFLMNGKISASGNIMSLVNSNEKLTEITANYCFANLFTNCSALVNSPDLCATALIGTYAYYYMFNGCTSLSVAPELPATLINNYSYQRMFYDCTSLQTPPPELPAAELKAGCYNYMFYDCSSLTSTPAMSTANGITNCCVGMFYNCYSLRDASNIQLPQTFSGRAPCQNMFRECHSLTAAPTFPASAVSIANTYRYMFYGCHSLSTPPVLSALSVTGNYAYGHMFYDCSSLTSAPELPATAVGNYAYQYMFDGCLALKDGPYLPATKVGTQSYAYMFAYCHSLSSINVNLSSLNQNSSTLNWLLSTQVNGVFYCKTVLGTNDTITRGTSYCPDNWTVYNI